MSSKEFIIWWNNSFPYDRHYRKKYNIGFGSPEHRAMCQLDIKLGVLEVLLFEEHEAELELIELEKELFESGKIIKKGGYISREEADIMFDNLDLSKI